MNDETKTKKTSETRQRMPYTAPRVVESGQFERLLLGCTSQPSPPAQFPGCGPGAFSG